MNEGTEFLLDGLEGIEDLKEFDAAEHLTTKEVLAAYLSFAFRSGDIEHFKEAIKTAVPAEKMSKIAAYAGITREGAYKALKPGSKPQMQTIIGLLDALGWRSRSSRKTRFATIATH